MRREIGRYAWITTTAFLLTISMFLLARPLTPQGIIAALACAASIGALWLQAWRAWQRDATWVADMLLNTSLGVSGVLVLLAMHTDWVAKQTCGSP
jgi:hypothetical protein